MPGLQAGVEENPCRLGCSRYLICQGDYGVIIDRCPTCSGIWLDHGDLGDMREENIPTPRPVGHVVERTNRKHNELC